MAEPLTISIVGVTGTVLGAGIYRLVLAVLPTILKNNGDGRIKHCGDHQILITQLTKNTTAVESLVDRADKHHKEQREDIHSIFNKINDQTKIITEHEVKIKMLEKGK